MHVPIEKPSATSGETAVVDDDIKLCGTMLLYMGVIRPEAQDLQPKREAEAERPVSSAACMTGLVHALQWRRCDGY